jgi:hypothetical protein
MLDFLSVPEDSGSGFGFSRIWFSVFRFGYWIQTGIKNSCEFFKIIEKNNPIFLGEFRGPLIVVQH